MMEVMLLDTAMSIAENIKQLRERAGYSQAKFGRLIGKSPRMVSHWESGGVDPTLGDIAKIAEVLDVLVDDIFRVGGTLPKAEADARRLVLQSAKRYGWVAIYDKITGLVPIPETPQEPAAVADDSQSTLKMPAPKHEPVSVPERQPVTGEPLTVKSPKKGRSRKSS